MEMFKPTVPALAVLGGKASGKTTAAEIIVKALASKGLSIMTVKHVSQRGFTLDREGTDTWRHWKAGAVIVSAVSDSEKAIMIKEGGNASLIDLDPWRDKIDAIIFEGFSSRLMVEEKVGKVICVKDLAEKERYLAEVRGRVIAFCSLSVGNDGVLKLGVDDDILGKQALQYIFDIKRKMGLEVV